MVNTNAGAMGALATLLTALATIAVAVFSYGTWKLYQMQRRSTDTSKAILAANILSFVHVTWSYLNLIKNTLKIEPNKRKFIEVEMREIIDSIPNFRSDIRTKITQSQEIEPKAIVQLNVADHRLF